MIKFEKHDNQLFRMLEEPVPLTPDAEMPCLVRLIQDDSRLGILNKLLHEGCYHEKYLCTSCNHQVCHILINGEEYDDFYPKYEIIGYPVADGSNDWALYQMMQGEKVCHEKAQSIMYCEHAGYIRREVRYNCVDHMSVSVWLDGADNTGWQIYTEPEQPKPKYQVGDWVEHKESKEQATIRRIMSYGAIEIDFAYSTESDIYQANDFHNDFRKLSPSEVIVRIGCLSGTIAKSCDPNYFLMLHSRPATDCNHSMIRFSAIDTETRSLVESLLKAQKEEE